MNREHFVEAIVQEPANEALRLAFSDWLEEQGEYDACLRVRETADVRPEWRRGMGSWQLYRAPVRFWSEPHYSVLPEWLFDQVHEAFHGHNLLSVAGLWFVVPSQEEGMRAIIEAILKGGPTWQPCSSGAESGSSGAAAR